jgi:soluble lytic murein transglycosylase
LPRARPDVVELPLAERTGDTANAFPPDLLMRTILQAVDNGQYGFARFLAATHSNSLVKQLTLWLIAREDDSGLSPADIRALETSHPDWPDADRLAWRAEQAFFATQPDGPAVLNFYSDRNPSSVRGRLAKADALRAAGHDADADALVRTIWRDGAPSAAETVLILNRHAGAITDDDRHYRFRRAVLSLRGDISAESALMGPGYLALGEAVRAALRRDPGAPARLRQVAPGFFGDPLYLLARSRILRREGKPVSAARLLLQIEPPAELQGDGSIWWEERKDLSRELLDLGFPEISYAIAAGHRAVDPVDRAEAEFHAGWYALRFAGKPRLAERHFRNLAAVATLPRSRSRALYWLARAYQADGRAVSATAMFQEASAFGGTYYGQLAREAVGLQSTGVEAPPTPTASDRHRIAESPLVQAAALLASGGKPDESIRFLRRVAETATAPGEITLLVEFARRLGTPRAGIQLATLAEQRGLQVGSLSTPFLGVPQRLPLPDSVDRALVYAVARQESALNHVATSRVGAQGLMQLMPATARATARQAGLTYSAARLSTDPTYNATLGAKHLDELLARFQGSYVLTFVAYNAGPGRANDWVRAYGDPRGNQVDAIDWIERIPFDETRHYVQKVMENLQIYRSRLGRPLSLARDMARGGPEG